jgi:hypothetical protein
MTQGPKVPLRAFFFPVLYSALYAGRSSPMLKLVPCDRAIAEARDWAR